MLVELAYGGAMWDKPTGTLRVSGLALPTGQEPQLGDWVQVELAGIRVAALVGNEVRVTSWVCTPTGYQFAGEKIAQPDIGGALGSVFECYAEYLSTIGVDVSLQMNIDTSQLKIASSPHPNKNQGWHSISSAIESLGGGGWTIPQVANVPVETMALNGYENASVVVGSMVPGANKLYLVDGFNSVVTKMTALTSVPENASSVSFGTHFGETIETSGGAADPTADPRPDESDLKLSAEFREITEASFLGSCNDNFPSSIYCETEGPGIFSSNMPEVYIMGIFLTTSTSPWAILASNSYSQWIRAWGPKKETIPETTANNLPNTFLDALYDTVGGDKPAKHAIYYYDLLMQTCVSMYNLWWSSDTFDQRSYTFKNLYGMSNPQIYQNPITHEELTVTAINNPFYDTLLEGIHEDEFELAEVEKLQFHLPDFTFTGVTESEGIEGQIDEKYMKELTKKMEEHDGLITCTSKSFVYEEECTGSISLGSIPYLFRRVKEINIDYRISPAVLNFNSEFWNVKHEKNTDFFLTDSRGQRVWIFPHDNVELFCKNMIISKILRDWWTTVPSNNKRAVLGSYLGVITMIKSSMTMGYYLSDLLNVKLNTSEVDEWRRFLNELKGWAPDPVNQIISTVTACSLESPGTASSAMSYYLMRQKHPDLREKVRKKAPYIDDSFFMSEDGEAVNTIMIQLEKALTWMFDYGTMRNLQGKPIATKKTTITYGENTRIIHTDNFISGDKHSSEEMLPAGGAVLYATPAKVRASTATTVQGAGAVSTETTRISNWDDLSSFDSSMTPFEGKQMVFYSMSDKFETASEGYEEAMNLLSKKHIRNVRLNVAADGRSTVGHSLMGILEDADDL